jgi:hypothetical protein
MASSAAGRIGLVALWSRYAYAANIGTPISWRRPSNRTWPEAPRQGAA